MKKNEISKLVKRELLFIFSKAEYWKLLEGPLSRAYDRLEDEKERRDFEEKADFIIGKTLDALIKQWNL
jgi:hypothetical protein